MTAIKPAETRRVQAVAAETYPVNAQCAWPDSDAEAVDPHHCFPRSAIGGDSYFVSLTFYTYEEAIAVVGKKVGLTEVPGTGWVTHPIPHVTGLSRQIHDEIEARHYRISLEGGVYIAYERSEYHKGPEGAEGGDGKWVDVGPLQPQPGGTGGKTRKRFKGNDRRVRKTISFRVPNDAGEDGAGLLDEKAGQLRESMGKGDDYPFYHVVSAALDYTILNADETDFPEDV